MPNRTSSASVRAGEISVSPSTLFLNPSCGKLCGSREFSFFGITVMGLPCCRVITVLFQILWGWRADSREMKTYQST